MKFDPRYEPSTIDAEGRCICGTPLPPMNEWHGAGRDWQHVRCAKCSTLYVDEEEFTAIYEDHPEPCCAIEEPPHIGSTAKSQSPTSSSEIGTTRDGRSGAGMNALWAQVWLNVAVRWHGWRLDRARAAVRHHREELLLVAAEADRIAAVLAGRDAP